MPQYLSSNDPDVIATIRRNLDCRPRFVQLATTYAESVGLGVEHAMFWSSPGVIALSGFSITPDGPGRWTKKMPSQPFRNNPERKKFDAVRVTEDDVPGLPAYAHSDTIDRDGTSMLMWPKPFIVDGTAWVMYSHMPHPNTNFGPQWNEVLASKAYAAKEAYEAQR